MDEERDGDGNGIGREGGGGGLECPSKSQTEWQPNLRRKFRQDIGVPSIKATTTEESKSGTSDRIDWRHRM